MGNNDDFEDDDCMEYGEGFKEKKGKPQFILLTVFCNLIVKYLGFFTTSLSWEVKKAITIRQKCIFQPLHNGVKSVLGIKESYSMGKKS